MVDLIRSNKYVPQIEDEKSSDSSNSDSNDDNDDDDNYLHPLLSKNVKAVKQPEVKTSIDSAKFKPNIKNSPYNDLIEKFTAYSYVILLKYVLMLQK